MKGPAQRIKYNFHRVWECPACQERLSTGGEATSQLCHCQRKTAPELQVWMRLIEDGADRQRVKWTYTPIKERPC